MHAGPGAAGVSRKIGAHLINIMDDDPGVTEQAFACRGRLDAATSALQQSDAKGGFQALDPGARRRQSEMGARRTLRDAAAVGHRDEQGKVNQIETHGGFQVLVERRRSPGSTLALSSAPSRTMSRRPILRDAAEWPPPG